MPPYGSTTLVPQRTRNSVASGSPSLDWANSRRARPSAGTHPRRRDTRLGRGSGNRPDRPSRDRSDRTRRDGRPRRRPPHAGGPGLVDVLAPFLAQVAPERLLVGPEVDDPGRIGLDRRRRPPASARRARRSAPSRSCGPSTSISGSIRRCDTRPTARLQAVRTASVNAAMSSADQSPASGPRGA